MEQLILQLSANSRHYTPPTRLIKANFPKIYTFANGRDAFESWVSATVDAGRAVPKPLARPAELIDASGRFVARLPKSLHSRLAARAKKEGVNLNTLAVAFIAEGLGHREACGH